jgi:uncharacterized membrane protein YdjX (TVP38/TMEM64 family)
MAANRWREYWKEYLWLAIVGGILITAVFLVRKHEDWIGRFIERHTFWGVFLYLILNVLDAVLAPGATLPLIPVASQVWGRVLAALATTAGWTLGSLIAFLIARRWGYPIVRKLTSIRRVRSMRGYIPDDLFWSIVFARLVLPMDVISYVLGLFTHIGWWEYLVATALGVTPSAFLLTYLGQLPHAYEVMAFGIGTMLLIGSFLVKRRRKGSVRAAASH